MVGIVEGTMIRSYSYSVSDSGMIGRGYFDGCIQKFLTFQMVFLTEVCVEIHEGGEVDTWTGIFVPEWFLKEGLHKDSELM